MVKNVTIDNVGTGLYVGQLLGFAARNVKVTGSDNDSSYGLYANEVSGSVRKLVAHGANHGLYAYGYADPLLIEDSKASNAGSTGFYIGNSTPFPWHRYILRRNTANNAGEYGFYAGYDTFGGGNKAKGAGTKNCFNVPC